MPAPGAREVSPPARQATAGAAGIDRVASVAHEKAYEILGFFSSVMAKDLWLSVDRARKLLGWSARRVSILDDLATGSYAAH